MASMPKEASSQAARILQKVNSNFTCESNLLDLADVAAPRQRSALHSESGIALESEGFTLTVDPCKHEPLVHYSAMFIALFPLPACFAQVVTFNTDALPWETVPRM